MLDDDVPSDPHVSVHAKNVRLSTALNLLSDVAGVSWRHEVRGDKKTVHVGKKVAPGTGAWIMRSDGKGAKPFVFDRTEKFVIPKIEGDGPHVFIGPDNFKLDPRAKPGQPPVLHDIPFMNRLFDNGFTWTMPAGERSTFTCPHCHGKVVMVRMRQQPQCPKCGRTFEPGWQYCPADGAKRPTSPADWQYCPLCGKRVEIDKIEKGDK